MTTMPEIDLSQMRWREKLNFVVAFSQNSVDLALANSEEYLDEIILAIIDEPMAIEIL
jgi:hypothetical protein